MKIRFRYRNDRLQEMLIRRLQPTDVKFRIRSDRSIEFAEKWYPEIDAEANELRFEIFQEPVILIWKESKDIAVMLHQLADKNIPFVIENHNGIDWIVYEKADIDSFCKIEADIGVQLISSDPTNIK
jgi:hypothetical protein